jgi:hypothetical protein
MYNSGIPGLCPVRKVSININGFVSFSRERTDITLENTDG